MSCRRQLLVKLARIAAVLPSPFRLLDLPQASSVRKCPSIPSWTLIDVPTTGSILIYS
jgi:hypothetical protein